MKTIDKAIRNCTTKDGTNGLHIIFYRDYEGDVNVEKFYDLGQMESRERELKNRDIAKKIKTWTHAEWSHSKSEFNSIYNKLKNSV